MDAFPPPAPILRPGTLWPAIVRQTDHALRRGALRPIATVPATVRDAGVDFVVRMVSSLVAKENDKPAGAPADPFLPYEPDLFVADVSDSHVALLNKFNVLDHHLLIATRAFEAQEALLTPADFAALLACMAEFDSLGFYNSSSTAGASQPHKHLQVVPLPIGDGGPAFPIAPLLASARIAGRTGTVPGLAFAHAYAPLDWHAAPAERMAGTVCACYRALLAAIGILPVDVARQETGESPPPAAYNLLVLPTGLLAVPRSRKSAAGIPINALGFAGSLFVRDTAQMRTIARVGPMAVLRGVSGPIHATNRALS